jgi:hypothetical protein
MAIMSVPVLTITSGDAPDRSNINVKYVVTFDHYDVASDQPYHAHIDLAGDDTGTGDGSTAGGDDQLYLYGAGDIWASQGTNPRVFSNNFSVPTSALNEDSGSIPNPDEIRAVVTLTPLAPKVVGPVESPIVALTL